MTQVAQAHSGFNQPGMLPSELQVHDETVNQHQQQVTAVQIVRKSHKKAQINNKGILINIVCLSKPDVSYSLPHILTRTPNVD